MDLKLCSFSLTSSTLSTQRERSIPGQYIVKKDKIKILALFSQVQRRPYWRKRTEENERENCIPKIADRSFSAVVRGGENNKYQ